MNDAAIGKINDGQHHASRPGVSHPASPTHCPTHRHPRTTGLPTTYNETGLLDTVAHRLVEHDPENVELISAVRIVWRTYSGVAHGLR